MADMIISTYMSFLPQNTSLFCCIVLAIGFFGIFIPYQEHKKKKRQAQKHSPKQAEKPGQTVSEKPGTQKKLEQLKTLRTAGIISEEEYQEKKRELQRQ